MASSDNYHAEITKLFRALDAPFLRYDRNRVEPIVWQAQDFLLTQRHEVRVPALPGSNIKFTFSTKQGDISFGLHFITPMDHVEVIREPMREPSDVEPIKGSYNADYEGIFVLIFDNSFSWFTDKLLSYNIQLIQVIITVFLVVFTAIFD